MNTTIQNIEHAHEIKTILRQENEQLRQRITHLETALAAVQDVAALEMENARLVKNRDELQAQLSGAVQERDGLRAELRDVIASAFPNQREHPTMWAAWCKAQAALTSTAGGGKHE